MTSDRVSAEAVRELGVKDRVHALVFRPMYCNHKSHRSGRYSLPFSFLDSRRNSASEDAELEESASRPALTWPKSPPVNKIDTHHHFVPDFYAKAVEQAGGDPSGWPTPRWSADQSLWIMDELGIEKAVLSITAPGACVLSGKPSYDLARKLNLEAAKLRQNHPTRFAMFGSLPSLLDTDAAVEELRFALDELKADGITLFTRYGPGNVYLGHPSIEPIWAELSRRKCVVFVHPTHPVDTNPVNPKMPQPMIDYPHETSRSAMDMILNNTRIKYPDCKVILSNAGGSLPYLISRLAVPLEKTQNAAATLKIGTNHSNVMESFRSFHFDLALSSSPAVLRMLLETVPLDHILYGSDFPYAPLPAYPAFLQHLEDFDMDSKLRNKINFLNAKAILPHLSKASL